MKKKLYLTLALTLLLGFALWTWLIQLVDVQPIGPLGTKVGLATMNKHFHDFTEVHYSLYVLTDWLSLIPIGFMVGFAVLGAVQWIHRKSLNRVDSSIFVLGGFYVVIFALFTLFEILIVNYRPVLIEGVLEASYPSSTTMLVMCVMPTAQMQLHARMQKSTLRFTVDFLMITFTIFMVAGRLISGVHWLSDIIGGALLSAGLVALYQGICIQNLK